MDGSIIQKAPLMANMVKTLPAMQETRIQLLGWEDLLEKGMATHSSILVWRMARTEKPGEYSPQGHKESDTTKRVKHTHTLVRSR